jgi:hypothetical protein
MEKNNKNCGSCVHFDDGHCRKSGEDVGFFDENACFQSRDGETVTTKKCKCCERDLPLENFSKHIRTPDGYQPLCKECMSAKLKRGHSKQVVEKLQKKIVKVPMAFPEDPTNVIVNVDLSNPRIQEIKSIDHILNGGPLKAEKMIVEEYPLSPFSDEEIYNELAKRGWQGKLQKTIIITLPRNIEE